MRKSNHYNFLQTDVVSLYILTLCFKFRFLYLSPYTSPPQEGVIRLWNMILNHPPCKPTVFIHSWRRLGDKLRETHHFLIEWVSFKTRDRNRPSTPPPTLDSWVLQDWLSSWKQTESRSQWCVGLLHYILPPNPVWNSQRLRPSWSLISIKGFWDPPRSLISSRCTRHLIWGHFRDLWFWFHSKCQLL